MLGRRGWAAALIALALLVPARAAAPASGITQEVEQTWETAVVERISDGDTVRVTILTATNPEMFAPATGQTFCDNRISESGKIPKEGLTGCLVRLVAVQAPETAGHGIGPLAQCGAAEAEQALAKALPVGTMVQLRSINVTSGDPKYAGGRLVRSVYAPDGSGSWVDVARSLYRTGLVMWFPFNVGDTEKPEYAHNLEYRRLADQAATAKLGLWSDNLCGTSAPAAIRMWVVANPAGRDTRQGETVVIVNDGAGPLDVGGWTIRDSSLKWAQLPVGTTIPAGDFINIHTSAGTAGSPTARDFYMGRADSMFANYDPANNYYYGDSAYLFDVQPGFDYGNLRAHYHYPCDPDSCWDRLVGSVTIGTVQANPTGTDSAKDEYIELRNSTGDPVSLGGYQLLWPGHAFAFDPTTQIPAHGRLRAYMGTGKDATGKAGKGRDPGRPATVHLGLDRPALANGSDVIQLANLNASVVDCRSWGSAGCPVGVPQSVPPSMTRTNSRSQPIKLPSAPRNVSATRAGSRVVVSWTAPSWPGVSPIEKTRARVYRKVGQRYKYVTSCTAFGPASTCRTRKVGKGELYVRVAARNGWGYGPRTDLVAVQGPAAS